MPITTNPTPPHCLNPNNQCSAAGLDVSVPLSSDRRSAAYIFFTHAAQRSATASGASTPVQFFGVCVRAIEQRSGAKPHMHSHTNSRTDFNILTLSICSIWYAFCWAIVAYSHRLILAIATGLVSWWVSHERYRANRETPVHRNLGCTPHSKCCCCFTSALRPLPHWCRCCIVVVFVIDENVNWGVFDLNSTRYGHIRTIMYVSHPYNMNLQKRAHITHTQYII